MKPADPNLLNGSPLTRPPVRFATRRLLKRPAAMRRGGGAPPRGEHLVRAILAIIPTACAPKAPPPAAIALDCSQPFEAQKAKITAQPNLNAAPAEPGEPYRAYSTVDGKASYFITEPGAPAHPTILMQQVGEGGAMKNTGCAYGDKAAFDQLTAYLESLRAGQK